MPLQTHSQFKRARMQIVTVQCPEHGTRGKNNVEGAQRREKLMCRRIGSDVTKMERLRCVLKDE